MIFITPNTIRSPDEMIKSSAAVVTASRATVNISPPDGIACGRSCRPREYGRKHGLSRHCERSEAIQGHARDSGLLRRGACHRARIRATRWLPAMTVCGWRLFQSDSTSHDFGGHCAPGSTFLKHWVTLYEPSA